MDSLNALLKAAQAASKYDSSSDEYVENPSKSKKKKYKLTDETMEFYGHTLHRILITKDPRKGHYKSLTNHLGGWVESEDNLSQDGWCLVCDDAKVYGNARVEQNATVSDNAIISGNAIVSGDAFVDGNTCISDTAYIGEGAVIYDNAKISGCARVIGDAHVFDSAQVSGNATITGEARVFEEAIICDNSFICGNAIVTGRAKILEGSTIYGHMCIEDGESHGNSVRYSSNNLPPANINEIEYGIDKYTPDGILIPKCSKENKKYIFTENYITLYDTAGYGLREVYVFQIQRIRDGTFGGYIQSEDNLSYDGDCWLTDSYVYDNARLCENAVLSNKCYVYENAYIHGNAILNNNVKVCENAEIYDNAVVSLGSKIYGNAKVRGEVIDKIVKGNTVVD